MSDIYCADKSEKTSNLHKIFSNLITLIGREMIDYDWHLQL